MRKTRRRSRRRKQRGGDYEDRKAIASLTKFMESWLLMLAKNQVEIGNGLKKVPGYNAGLLAASPKKKVAMKIKATSAFNFNKRKKGGRRKSRRKKRRKSRKSRRKRRKRSRRRRR